MAMLPHYGSDNSLDDYLTKALERVSSGTPAWADKASNSDNRDTDSAPYNDGGLRDKIAALLKPQVNQSAETFDAPNMGINPMLALLRSASMRPEPDMPAQSQQDAHVRLKHIMDLLPVIQAQSGSYKHPVSGSEDLGTPWNTNNLPVIRPEGGSYKHMVSGGEDLGTPWLNQSGVKRDMHHLHASDSSGSGIAALLSILES